MNNLSIKFQGIFTFDRMNISSNKNMKILSLLLLVLSASVIVSCNDNNTDNTEDIIIENDQFRLILSKEGYSKSLVNKSIR